MLTALSIRDVVLIERLDLAFGAGLTVLTGETGAGKSILLDRLVLAPGARADAGLVPAGACRRGPRGRHAGEPHCQLRTSGRASADRTAGRAGSGDRPRGRSQAPA